MFSSSSTEGQSTITNIGLDSVVDDPRSKISLVKHVQKLNQQQICYVSRVYWYITFKFEKSNLHSMTVIVSEQTYDTQYVCSVNTISKSFQQ